MNTANVMAVATKAGAQVKGQGAKPAVKVGKGSAKGMESFGDALGKLDQEVKEALTQTATQEQGSTADDGDVMEDAPKDPLAAVLAASQQGNDTQGKDIVEPLQQVTEPVTVVDVSAEAEAAFINKPVAESENAANLQSLLPQPAEAGRKNQDFLAMLSGQHLKSSAVKEQNVVVKPEAKPQQASTALEAQLLSVQQTGKEPKIAAQQAGAFADTALRVEVPATGQQLQPKEQLVVPEQTTQEVPRAHSQQFVNTVETQELAKQPAMQQVVMHSPAAKEASKEDKPVASLLGDAELTVEEQPDVVPLRMDAQQAMRQPGQQAGQQEQPASQQTNQSLAGKAEQLQQLPEEAAGDRAVASQPAGSNTVSVFQQSLQESIHGIEVPKAQDVQQPQTNFDIPRQIVDQARLIRRAEDTQMVIKLHPEHLGELTLKVSVTQNGSVNASFHSDNAQVRAVIENSLVQLRQELNNQGLKVDSVEVYAGLADGQLPQEQGQQAWQNQQGGSANRIQGITLDAEEYGEEADQLAAAAMQGTNQPAVEGVDYRI